MQPKNTPKIRRKYDRTGEPADFKIEVLKKPDSGQTATYSANVLGVSDNLIYRWKSSPAQRESIGPPMQWVKK